MMGWKDYFKPPFFTDEFNPELNEAEVDWCKQMFADLVPYDDPNYEKRIDALARSAILGERDPDFIAMCEEHDRMMEEKNG